MLTSYDQYDRRDLRRRRASRCCWSATRRPTTSSATRPRCRSPSTSCCRWCARSAAERTPRAGRRRPAVRLLPGVARAGARDVGAVHEGGRRARGQARGRRAPWCRRSQALVAAGIPVMAHIGFTPQSEHGLGGYRVQGRGDAGRPSWSRDAARAGSEAGAFAVVLEMVPADVAKRVTAELAIPTIGIGAGADCDGQVLVWQDMAGLRTRPDAAVRQAVRRPARHAHRGRPGVRRRRRGTARSRPRSTPSADRPSVRPIGQVCTTPGVSSRVALRWSRRTGSMCAWTRSACTSSASCSRRPAGSSARATSRRCCAGRRRRPGGCCSSARPTEEPWHLAAHLDDEARFAGVPELSPTLVRWSVPSEAPPHLSVGMARLEAARSDETVFVVAPDAAPERLLERVADARRIGATILSIDDGDDELGIARARTSRGADAPADTARRRSRADLCRHGHGAAPGERCGR